MASLIRFSAVDRTALRWLRTSESPVGFSLLSGDAPVATLLWAKRGGSLATLTTADGSWTMKRAGFLAPSILVRTGDRPEPVGRLNAHLRRHEVRIAGAPAYWIQHISHILPSWKVVGDRGEEVLHIEPVAERGSLRGGAVVVSSGSDRPEALLLVSMSWYFIVLAWLEDELVEALTPFEGPDAPTRVEWPRAPTKES